MKSQKVLHPQLSRAPAALLSVSKPANLRLEMQDVQLAITRRAYELFQERGREHGHDWEDWFRAESELLHPVSVSVQDSADRISVLVNVLGFQEKDLKVSIEPSRISILGKKEGSAAGGHSLDRHPDRILQCIDLATEVVPESAVVELEEGQLKFELHKVERKLETTVPAA